MATSTSWEAESSSRPSRPSAPAAMGEHGLRQATSAMPANGDIVTHSIVNDAFKPANQSVELVTPEL